MLFMQEETLNDNLMEETQGRKKKFAPLPCYQAVRDKLRKILHACMIEDAFRQKVSSGCYARICWR